MTITMMTIPNPSKKTKNKNKMIITKPYGCEIHLKDLLEIVVIDFTKCSINISYTFEINYDENLGFCHINDMEYLEEMLDYLNQENAACLIYIGEKTRDKPVHVTAKLCFASEFLSTKQNRKNKIEVEDFDRNILEIHEKPFDNFENCDTIFDMLKVAMGYDDLLIYMDTKGEFKSIKNLYNFEHNGIGYYSPGTYLKPSKPIEINSKVNSWECFFC